MSLSAQLDQGRIATLTSGNQAGVRVVPGITCRCAGVVACKVPILQRPVAGVNSATKRFELSVLLLEFQQPVFANFWPAVLRLPTFGDRHPCGPQK